jgi:hydrogenase nickel incorporation protein HypA/HybF
MHELSICQALIAKVEDIARERAGSVTAVHVRIGPLSGVEARLLADAYPLAAAGTAAEGSRLEVETAPVRVRCRSCAAESSASPNRLLCAACGDWRTDLISGDEMLLLRVELEVDDRPPPPGNAMESSHV